MVKNRRKRINGTSKSGELRDVLFIATGALLSATTAQQGKPIPAAAHLIHFVS